jgi:hypothetical protein
MHGESGHRRFDDEVLIGEARVPVDDTVLRIVLLVSP